MPLSMIKTGESQIIKKINGNDEIKHFLENLGFIVGAVVTVVSEMQGNMIVHVKGTRVAISKSMANRILV